MRILITNDDGILAPGLAALHRAVADLGEVYVVAPENTQSAMAHAITVKAPMSVRRVRVDDQFDGWAVDGTPADCVKLAMIELLPQRPDFVLSGINAGANTGVNVLYSGTVAGAAEGAFFGAAALAFSLELTDQIDFRNGQRVAREVFRSFAASRPAPGTCLNVNIPALHGQMPRGVRCCPQTTVPMQEHYRKEDVGDGQMLYWLDGRFPEPELCPDSDHAAVSAGYVSITPLRFDLTDHAALEALRGVPWPAQFE
jgi:5'-nucleotidase